MKNKKQDLCKLLMTVIVSAFVTHSDAQIITTVAGQGPTIGGYSGDGGAATAAALDYPVGLAFDASGNFYISDGSNSAIRKVDITTGRITTVAGMGPAHFGYSGDGGPATAAELKYTGGIAIDISGNLYIVDATSHVVRKVDAAGIITTVAGNGTNNYSGDGGAATAAALTTPEDVATDNSGNLYISDQDASVIRKVSTSGIITTIAGAGPAHAGYTGDGGPATAAGLASPKQIALDGAGNLYIADWGNSVIRKIDAATNIITTIAGNGTHVYSGDGGPATAAGISASAGVAVDAAGNIYIASDDNYHIRRVNTSGIISTVAGTGIAGYSGDGGLAVLAQVNAEQYFFIRTDANGNLFVADEFNHAVRKITTGTTGTQQTTSTSNNIVLSPNPNNGTFTIKGFLHSLSNERMLIEVVDMTGSVMETHTITAQKGLVNAPVKLSVELPGGTYLLHLTSATENNTLRFVIEK